MKTKLSIKYTTLTTLRWASVFTLALAAIGMAVTIWWSLGVLWVSTSNTEAEYPWYRSAWLTHGKFSIGGSSVTEAEIKRTGLDGPWWRVLPRKTPWEVWYPDWYVAGDAFSVQVPLWIVCVGTTPVALMSWWPVIVARQRRRGGLCLQCGYDLNGQDTRCPECGRERGGSAN